MIIEPDLIHHWKFEALCVAVGDAGAYRALLRLWGYAQARKQWIFPLDALKLASICGLREDAAGFWEHMTGRAGWIEAKGGGWFELRGWANLNRSMIQAWCSKTKRLAWMDEYDAALKDGEGSCDGGAVEVGRSYDAPYDPSCEAPGDASYDGTNRGDRGDGMDRGEGGEIEKMDAGAPPPALSLSTSSMSPTAPLCSLEEAIAHAPMCRLSADAAMIWWHTRNSTGWFKATAGGGAPKRVVSWQSDMASARDWAEERAQGRKQKERMALRL